MHGDSFQGQVSGLYIFSHKSSSQFWRRGEKGRQTQLTCQVTKESLAHTWYFFNLLLECTSTYLALCTINELFYIAMWYWWICGSCEPFVSTSVYFFQCVLAFMCTSPFFMQLATRLMYSHKMLYKYWVSSTQAVEYINNLLCIITNETFVLFLLLQEQKVLSPHYRVYFWASPLHYPGHKSPDASTPRNLSKLDPQHGQWRPYDT